MKYMVMAWQANSDIQYLIDAYSCVMYIHDESQKAMSA